MRREPVCKMSKATAVPVAVSAVLCWLCIVAAGHASPAKTSEWTFDNDPVGGPPAGATVFGGSWAVRAETGAPSLPNALCQIGSAEFPALALSATVYTDATIEADFKAISGREDQAAGIIFRIQDRNNYYIVRANALEGNVNIYKYVRGRRIFIKGTNANVPSNRWQELGVEAMASRIRGFLNRHLVVDAADDAFKAGKIGLWTKADSVTCFDNIRVTTK